MLLKLLLFLGALAHGVVSGQTLPLWQTLPPTPDLPSPISLKTTPINGVQLWMQEYNKEVGGIPIVFDHGGLGYSAYFGSVISRLVDRKHYVIALDRRGHGRSTFNKDDVFTYDKFAVDIDAQLKAAGIHKYNVVGWSDGAITTLSALANPSQAKSIHKAFILEPALLLKRLTPRSRVHRYLLNLSLAAARSMLSCSLTLTSLLSVAKSLPWKLRFLR